MKAAIIVLALVIGLCSHSFARVIPERNLDAPATVSPQLKTAIDMGLPDWQKISPQTEKEWKIFQQMREEESKKQIPLLQKALNVKISKRKIAGVAVFDLTPAILPAKNDNRVLLHLHGGGYVLGAGDAGLSEAIYMAGLGHFKVISADYRMAPQFPFPAALDDALQVYRALLEQYPAANIGVFGTSAGGALTLSLALAAKKDGLPLPGAIAAGTPWADLAPNGDTYYANSEIDNVLVNYGGWLQAAVKAYAGQHDLQDPLLSPIYGDLSGFPPTFLASGTRDLFLSNTARMHRKLLEANVISPLLVLEGISHAQYLHLGPDAPETVFYFGQMAKFFEQYLGEKAAK